MSVEFVLAGRGRRLAASLIDVLLVPTLAIFIMLATGILEHAADWSASGRPMLRIFALGVASYLILNVWPLWRRGQSVGKVITGIAIVSTKSGNKAPFWRLAIRALFFPTLYLIVWPLAAAFPLIDQVLIFGKRRRCVHDYVCGTSVVKRG